MWLSCCHWLCDSVEGEGPEVGRDQQASQPACEACRGRCDTPALHVCVDCKKHYCGGCSAQLDIRPRLCHTCQRFYGKLLERAELMKLKVKDLRDYLHLHEVSTQMCREKEELVDLVLVQQTPSPTSPTQAPPTQAPPTQAPPTPATPTQAPSEEGRDSQDERQPVLTSEEMVDSGVQEERQTEDVQLSDSEEPQEAQVPGRRASLSDLSSVEEVGELTVRQLKEILARNFVNYTGCCEKWELMERVTRLYRDHNHLGAEEDSLCKVCMDQVIDCVLLECGHMVTCTKCGKRMSECPMCRQFVVRAVHVFKS